MKKETELDIEEEQTGQVDEDSDTTVDESNSKPKDLDKKAKKKDSGQRRKKQDKTIQALQDEIQTLKDEIQTLKDEIDAQKETVQTADEKVMRAYAEMENFKKRKEQEKVEFLKFANEKIVTELIPILDSFDMAVSQYQDNEQAKPIVQGFELIQKQLQTALEKAGVTRIDAVEQPFDPNLHQAISQEASESHASNIVLKEMQPGYQLNERVIRPSMVVVSS